MLTQFSRDERLLSGAELSRRLGLPRASVCRILQTLEQLGFETLASMELTEIGRPTLNELFSATGLSAGELAELYHRVSAAVSVAVPAQQVELVQLDELVAQVRWAAQRLSQRIHHSPIAPRTRI